MLSQINWFDLIVTGVKASADQILHTNYRSLAELQKEEQDGEEASGMDAMQVCS